jgi:hypothetical protein
VSQEVSAFARFAGYRGTTFRKPAYRKFNSANCSGPSLGVTQENRPKQLDSEASFAAVQGTPLALR